MHKTVRATIAGAASVSLLLTGTAVATNANAQARAPLPPATVAAPDTAAANVVDHTYYDFATHRLFVDPAGAISAGFTPEEVETFNANFSELGAAETDELLEIIGVNISHIRQPRIPQIILGIAAVVGGALAGELVSQVANHGIAAACRNFQGNIDLFDNFCRDNGHIE